MTIDTQYSFETFNLNPAKTYVFTFEHIGASTIDLYWVDSLDNATYIDPGSYTLTPGGVPPIYLGGTIVINITAPASALQLRVQRSTPVTQLVDLEPYTPFPAETMEFALDKLTLIQQEQGKGDGTDIPVDPNTYVPLAGTKVGFPMTGTLQMLQGNAQDWRIGALGAPFNWFGITNLKLGATTQPFVVSVNNNYTVFDPSGDVYLSTVYDVGTPSNAAATVQYVLDAVGGPGAAFIPLAGTAPGEEVTGLIEFNNVTLGLDYTFGIEEGLTDVMTLSGNGAILLATGATATTQWFAFGVDGQLTLPDLDYTLVDDLSAVNKAYVDSVAGGGGAPNTFVPLAGTDASFPITGPLEFENIALNRSFSLGIVDIPGFEDGILFGAGGSSGSPSNFYWSTGGEVMAFSAAEGLQVLTATIGVTPNAGFDFTVDGTAIIGGGMTTAGIIASGVIVNGQVSADIVTLDNAAPLAANQATRKDYVDGLNAQNVKLTGDQSISGTKTFTGAIALTAGNLQLQIPNLASTTTGNFVRWFPSGGFQGFFAQSSTVTMAEVDGLPAMAARLSSAETLLTVARERIESLEAERDAFIQRFEAIEARLLAGGL